MKAGISLTGAYVKEGMAAAIPFSYCTNWQLYTVYQGVVFNVNNVKYYTFFVSLITTYIQ